MLVCEFCGEVFESLDALSEHLKEYHKINTPHPEKFAVIDPEVLGVILSQFFEEGEPYDDIDVTIDNDGIITIRFLILAPCITTPETRRDSELSALKTAFDIIANVPFGEFKGVSKIRMDDDNCYYVVELSDIRLSELL